MRCLVPWPESFVERENTKEIIFRLKLSRPCPCQHVIVTLNTPTRVGQKSGEYVACLVQLRNRHDLLSPLSALNVPKTSSKCAYLDLYLRQPRTLPYFQPALCFIGFVRSNLAHWLRAWPV